MARMRKGSAEAKAWGKKMKKAREGGGGVSQSSEITF